MYSNAQNTYFVFKIYISAHKLLRSEQNLIIWYHLNITKNNKKSTSRVKKNTCISTSKSMGENDGTR